MWGFIVCDNDLSAHQKSLSKSRLLMNKRKIDVVFAEGYEELIYTGE